MCSKHYARGIIYIIIFKVNKYFARKNNDLRDFLQGIPLFLLKKESVIKKKSLQKYKKMSDFQKFLSTFAICPL